MYFLQMVVDQTFERSTWFNGKKMFGQQPFGKICDNANANFTFPFWPCLHPLFLSFQTILSGQGGVCGWEPWLVSSCGPKPKIIKENKSLFKK